MKSQILKSLVLHAKGKIEKHKANVHIYLENPAGIEINCLTPGINLPINVVISPCLSKYFSDLPIFFLEINRNFPHLLKTRIKMTLPKDQARK